MPGVAPDRGGFERIRELKSLFVICRVLQMTATSPRSAPIDGAMRLDGCAIRVIDADHVEATRAKVLARPHAEAAAELFRLLGDAGRLHMLCALLEAGELCVCDLAAVVGMTESSVSHSLRLLRTAGIVRQRRSGRRVFYALDDAHVRLLLDVSIEHVGHGATHE